MKFAVKSCNDCGCDEFAVGPISRNGHCEACGLAIAVSAAVSMRARRGHAWGRWVEEVGKIIDAERARGGG